MDSSHSRRWQVGVARGGRGRAGQGCAGARLAIRLSVTASSDERRTCRAWVEFSRLDKVFGAGGQAISEPSTKSDSRRGLSAGGMETP